MNPPLDTQAVNLAKAIKRAETGGSLDPYNTQGKSGEHGAYQFMPNTWKMWAGRHLGDTNAQMSVENQNKVAYSQIKEWKDQGLNPAQIASKWNSGDENAYRSNHAGVNSQGVSYDTPGYVSKVSEYYRQANPQQTNTMQTGVTPTAPETPQEQTYGGDLVHRSQQGAEALGKLSNGLATLNGSDVFSGAIQTGGAVAGAIGDTVNAGLGLIPGYKQLQNAIGDNIVKPAAESDTGKGLINSWEEFATAHPDAAKNIGAAGNIVSVLPIIGSIKAVTGVAKNGITSAFKKTIENNAIEELKLATDTTMKGKGLVGKTKGRNPLDVIVRDGYLPDVVEDANGIPRYQTATARTQVQDALGKMEDELQAKLEQATGSTVAGYAPLDTIRAEAIRVAKSKFADRGQVGAAVKKINAIFDDYIANKGDLVTLTDLNKMKRGIREAVNFNSPKLTGDVRYQLGQVFMDVIEKGAKAQGIPGVHDLNVKMGSYIKADDVLKYLENRSVSERPGWRTLVGRRAGDTSTIAGEAIGQTLGVPGVGAFVGRAAGGIITKGNRGKNITRLKRHQTRKKVSLTQKAGALVPLLQNSTPTNQQEQRR